MKMIHAGTLAGALALAGCGAGNKTMAFRETPNEYPRWYSSEWIARQEAMAESARTGSMVVHVERGSATCPGARYTYEDGELVSVHNPCIGEDDDEPPAASAPEREEESETVVVIRPPLVEEDLATTDDDLLELGGRDRGEPLEPEENEESTELAGRFKDPVLNQAAADTNSAAVDAQVNIAQQEKESGYSSTVLTKQDNGEAGLGDSDQELGDDEDDSTGTEDTPRRRRDRPGLVGQ